MTGNPLSIDFVTSFTPGLARESDDWVVEEAESTEVSNEEDPDSADEAETSAEESERVIEADQHSELQEAAQDRKLDGMDKLEIKDTS